MGDHYNHDRTQIRIGDLELSQAQVDAAVAMVPGHYATHAAASPTPSQVVANDAEVVAKAATVAAAGGIKFDSGKPPFDLLPWEALAEVAKVLDYGRSKYAAHNWRKGMAWGRVLGAAFRHLGAFVSGQDVDPETGLPHLAHAACCVLFCLTYWLTKTGEDDRWASQTSPATSSAPLGHSSPKP